MGYILEIPDDAKNKDVILSVLGVRNGTMDKNTEILTVSGESTTIHMSTKYWESNFNKDIKNVVPSVGREGIVQAIINSDVDDMAYILARVAKHYYNNPKESIDLSENLKNYMEKYNSHDTNNVIKGFFKGLYDIGESLYGTKR